jgi:hypothetical protein
MQAPGLLLASLKAFGDGPEDPETLQSDSQAANEAATQDAARTEVAESLWLRLSKAQKELFVKTVRQASPPSPDVSLNELELMLG